MKRILSLFLALALMCTCMLALTACGAPKLEGTYTGNFLYEDTFTVTIKKNKTVELSLRLDADNSVETATGSYEIVADEGHNHGGSSEVMKFTVTSDKENGLLSNLNGKEFLYTLKKENGKKALTLSLHGTGSWTMNLTEVKP